MNLVNAKLNEGHTTTEKKRRQRFAQRSSNMTHWIQFDVVVAVSFPLLLCSNIFIFDFMRSLCRFVRKFWCFLYDAAACVHCTIRYGTESETDRIWKRQKANQIVQYWAYIRLVCLHWNAQAVTQLLLISIIITLFVFNDNNCVCLRPLLVDDTLTPRHSSFPLSRLYFIGLALEKVAIRNHANRRRIQFKLCI